MRGWAIGTIITYLEMFNERVPWVRQGCFAIAHAMEQPLTPVELPVADDASPPTKVQSRIWEMVQDCEWVVI